MLEEPKGRGDLIAAHRPTADSAYIEGVVQKVHVNGDDYFYEIAWEDGQHFGELFYEGELDEIDLEESEATIRIAMGEFLSEEALDEWFDFPNDRLKGLTPYEALETMGLRRVALVAVDDYTDALYEEQETPVDDEVDGQSIATAEDDDELESQMAAMFANKDPRG